MKRNFLNGGDYHSEAGVASAREPVSQTKGESKGLIGVESATPKATARCSSLVVIVCNGFPLSGMRTEWLTALSGRSTSLPGSPYRWGEVLMVVTMASIGVLTAWLRFQQSLNIMKHHKPH